jgi:hypothetical protein
MLQWMHKVADFSFLPILTNTRKRSVSPGKLWFEIGQIAYVFKYAFFSKYCSNKHIEI